MSRCLEEMIRVLVPYYLVILPAAVGIFLLELLLLGWKRSSLHALVDPGNRSARFDLYFSLSSHLGLRPILGNLLTFGLSTYACRSIRIRFPSPWVSIDHHPVMVAIFGFLVYELAYYAFHRLSHSWRPLWELHEFHHAATGFTGFSGDRVHPVETYLFDIVFAGVSALAGASLFEFAQGRALYAAYLILIHSNLRWNWGWFGDFVLVSPANHRLHHSDLPEHRDRNFSDVLPIFDWIFGTRSRHPHPDPVIEDRLYYHRDPWWKDIFTSYARSIRALVSFRRSALGNRNLDSSPGILEVQNPK